MRPPTATEPAPELWLSSPSAGGAPAAARRSPAAAHDPPAVPRIDVHVGASDQRIQLALLRVTAARDAVGAGLRAARTGSSRARGRRASRTGSGPAPTPGSTGAWTACWNCGSNCWPSMQPSAAVDSRVSVGRLLAGERLEARAARAWAASPPPAAGSARECATRSDPTGIAVAAGRSRCCTRRGHQRRSGPCPSRSSACWREDRASARSRNHFGTPRTLADRRSSVPAPARRGGPPPSP